MCLPTMTQAGPNMECNVSDWFTPTCYAVRHRGRHLVQLVLDSGNNRYHTYRDNVKEATCKTQCNLFNNQLQYPTNIPNQMHIHLTTEVTSLVINAKPLTAGHCEQ